MNKWCQIVTGMYRSMWHHFTARFKPVEKVRTDKRLFYIRLLFVWRGNKVFFVASMLKNNNYNRIWGTNKCNLTLMMQYVCFKKVVLLTCSRAFRNALYIHYLAGFFLFLHIWDFSVAKHFKQILLNTSGGVFRGILFSNIHSTFTNAFWTSDTRLFLSMRAGSRTAETPPNGSTSNHTRQQKKVCEQRRAGEVKRLCCGYSLSWRKKGDTEMKSSIQTFLAVPLLTLFVVPGRSKKNILCPRYKVPTPLVRRRLHLYNISLFLYSPPPPVYIIALSADKVVCIDSYVKPQYICGSLSAKETKFMSNSRIFFFLFKIHTLEICHVCSRI